MRLMLCFLGWLFPLWLGGLMLAAEVRAETDKTPDRNLVTLERTADGLFLSARLPLDLPAALEDVLYKGVPLHFVWQAQVLRDRWYWMDERMAQQTRVVRVAYQPLTRRWRVSVGSGWPADGAALNALHQNVDTLPDALAVVARVSNWRLLDPGRLDSDQSYRLEFRFYLDAGLLPRPFQIGIKSSGDWNISYEQVLEVPVATTGMPVSQSPEGALTWARI